MKVPSLLLLLAGAALGYIAWKSPEPVYRPPVATRHGGEIPQALSGEVPAGYQVQVYEVEGMCRDCCPPNVYETLTGIDGVVEAAVDMSGGRASAVVPAGFDAARIEQALTAREYPARVVPPPMP